MKNWQKNMRKNSNTKKTHNSLHEKPITWPKKKKTQHLEKKTQHLANIKHNPCKNKT